jgi:hypothetical protein
LKIRLSPIELTAEWLVEKLYDPIVTDWANWFPPSSDVRRSSAPAVVVRTTASSPNPELGSQPPAAATTLPESCTVFDVAGFDPGE